jgi:hypothetical protein
MNDVLMMSAPPRLERGDAGKSERYTSDKRDADTESLCNIEERASGRICPAEKRQGGKNEQKSLTR